eukprot:TRINITY_DN1104_c0_g5_i1.p1 TRINITY_DN1104_c0_g5~~TRINITY_DN1104_c0_g5_i1.p1  ORF type:complete len:526 (+),score=133.22 TRINITY_DN1104_c0_g5_i1:96-1673(+)
MDKNINSEISSYCIELSDNNNVNSNEIGSVQEEEDDEDDDNESSSNINNENKKINKSINLKITLEREEIKYNKADNMWAIVSLNSISLNKENKKMIIKKTNVDIVVVIDVSASMKRQEKLIGVLASIEYMLDELTEQDRLSIIQFNDNAEILCPLIYLTEENKIEIVEVLHSIKACGNTNISDGLFTALDVLEENKQLNEEIPRLQRIFLLTDGLTNRGLTQGSIIEELKKIKLDENLTIHTFGYGLDHSSALLQAISFCSSGGLYYYVESSDSIAQIFGECLAGTLTTVATNIRVRLEAFDGCRFIQFRTKYAINSIKSMKDYEILLGTMYESEQRSVLMRLSTRNLKQPREHLLFRLTFSYLSTIDNSIYSDQQFVTIMRSNRSNIPFTIPVELDKQINRIIAAEAIEQAIQSVMSDNYNNAKKKISNAVSYIVQSESANESYCKDLVDDLIDCVSGLSNSSNIIQGLHEAHVYSTMYFQERSCGNTIRRKQTPTSDNYGYITSNQKTLMQKASTAASRYRSA